MIQTIKDRAMLAADKYVKDELSTYNERYREAGRKDYAKGYVYGSLNETKVISNLLDKSIELLNRAYDANRHDMGFDIDLSSLKEEIEQLNNGGK